MYKKELEKWPKRIFLRRISTAVIIITLLLSAAIVGLSIYGNNVGNFVISIERETRLTLSLSETGVFDEENSTSVLNAGGLKNITNATYANIPEDVDDYNGQHSDSVNRRYMAYTFYVKNTSPIAVSYSMTLNINQVYKNVDGALRVLIITDSTQQAIYAKRNADGSVVEHNTVEEKHYSTLPFESSSVICSTFDSVFAEGAVRKYTVVMWLEGYDPDCTDEIKGGSIRITMDFAAK